MTRQTRGSHLITHNVQSMKLRATGRDARQLTCIPSQDPNDCERCVPCTPGRDPEEWPNSLIPFEISCSIPIEVPLSSKGGCPVHLVNSAPFGISPFVCTYVSARLHTVLRPNTLWHKGRQYWRGIMTSLTVKLNIQFNLIACTLHGRKIRSHACGS